MTRRGEYDLWGYRSTWGMGYHEILQFCEDTGMDCMFVGNAGLACIGSLGEYVSGAEAVEPYYQDIKDAIEYAIGDPATNEWAKRRADAGHPAPFPLKYVEIGNENFSKRYDDNFQYIYKKLKAEYPQLTFLNTMGIDHAEEFKLRLGDDMIDPHWYVTPEYFYNSRTIFDNTPRGHYNIYVGEYATNAQVGDGNLEATLSEASFMIDMERNSDIVKMASYAPLIQNSNAVNWRCNLIWQRSGESFGRASYYNQKMFSENVPSYNIKGEMHSDRSGVPYNGRAGIGTWLTSGKFRNFKVSDHSGKVLYTADFVNNRDEWTDMEGTWSLGADGLITQASTSKTRCISLMNTLAFRDGVIEVEAYKNAGGEGFLLVFGCDDNDWNH
ncbi:MAG: alpha-L-arabinofuranosidase, partial [Muribaculaceae bacterium]|nr:alpha-L-arabinofuranosidase [Muribaculaceae bacterium]